MLDEKESSYSDAGVHPVPVPGKNAIGWFDSWEKRVKESYKGFICLIGNCNHIDGNKYEFFGFKRDNFYYRSNNGFN